MYCISLKSINRLLSNSVLIIGIKRSIFIKTDFLHWSVVTLRTAQLLAEVKQWTMSTWSIVTLNAAANVLLRGAYVDVVHCFTNTDVVDVQFET